MKERCWPCCRSRAATAVDGLKGWAGATLRTTLTKSLTLFIDRVQLSHLLLHFIIQDLVVSANPSSTSFNMSSILRSLVSTASSLLLLCCLFQSTFSQTLQICYTLQPPAGTIYGNWSTVFSATLSVAAYTLPTNYAYTGAANNSYGTVYSISGITTGSRTFVSAIGTTYTSTLGALLSPNNVYAPSGITANINNDNLIFVNSAGQWTTSASGFAFTVTTTGSTPGAPGLPGFPRTSRFNSASIVKVSSASSGPLVETGFGIITIDGNIGAAASFTPSATYIGAVATTSLSSTSTAPACPTVTNNVAALNYISQGFCYIFYPHETASNGMYSIVASGVYLTSPTPYAVPGSQTGSPARSAYFIYGVSSVTRTYTDQYGQVETVSGAFLQGPGGDGGTSNFLYTARNTSDRYGGLVDGGGFTYTFYNSAGYGGVTTPGDPTLAFAINVYFEDNYREAAEPWHQDEEYAALDTSSFTITNPASAPPTCTATAFTPVTKPPNYGQGVQYSFCSTMKANTGDWTVYTTGTLTTTSTYFTSFATADTIFYQIGTAMTGTRTYTSSAGNSTITIGSLQSPGGDGQNSNKLYNASNPTAFDDGGWTYSIASGTPVIAGVTATGTTLIRLYYAANGWAEQAVPSFQTSSQSASSSTFTYQLASQGTIACLPGSGSGNNNAATSRAGGSASAVLLAGAAAAGVALLL